MAGEIAGSGVDGGANGPAVGPGRGRPQAFRVCVLLAVFALVAGFALGSDPRSARAEDPAVVLGLVTFLSGPAAGPFGIPAANAAEILIDALNAGTVPVPYDRVGMAGQRIQPVLVDEAGGTTKQVAEFRNLVERRGVDAVVGYISSGSCLGIAPVAEELRMLTVFFDCGTPRIFEDARYRYVFRTAAHATMDGVAAARYLLRRRPGLSAYAGLNQNYAWGQDSWRDFSEALKILKPDARIETTQFPKLFAGQYNAEITALMVSEAEAVHTSLWGGDLEAFLIQAGGRGLAERVDLIVTTGENLMYSMAATLPEGIIIGGRGPYGIFAGDDALNAWFQDVYAERFGTPPTYPAYHMAQAILGLKAATEAAAGGIGPEGRLNREAVIDAFTHSRFRSFGHDVAMSLGDGHQAVTETAYGVFSRDPETGAPRVTDIVRYPAECVNPPAEMTSAAWIAAGMPAGMAAGMPGGDCD